MAGVLRGRVDWGKTIDEQGHHEYTISFLVETTRDDDGPGIVDQTPRLPRIGAAWSYGNETDPWAFKLPRRTIRPMLTKEKGNYWTVDDIFSTKPPGGGKGRCQDQKIENPIMEPPRLRGGFNKLRKEGTHDRFGKPMRSSSHELLKGKAVEVDDNRPTVSVEINSLILPLALYAPIVDAVNDRELWGLQARMVKLSNIEWTRLYYGTCTAYYTTGYELEVNWDKWNIRAVDSGTKVLIGHGASNDQGLVKLNPDDIDPTTNKPKHLNPKNFEVYKDINGENTRVFLDGQGRPHLNSEEPYNLEYEYYTEANLLLLGIPAVL